MGEQLKYGHIRGGTVSVPVPLAASQAFKAKSGRFVYLPATTGHATICASGADEVFGFAEEYQRTSSSTAAAEKANIIIDPTAVFRIPVSTGTYVVSMRGKSCDIITNATTGIQGANLVAADDDVLIVVDGDDVDNKWVDVMISQNERAQSGVV
jgi:hypothetical protein